MTTRQKKAVAIMLIGAFGAVGYAYYQAQTRQAATLALITALETRLAVSNQQRAQAAKNTVFGISEVVSKNRNMAMDMAVLQQAQEIQNHTQALIDTLQGIRHAWQAFGRCTKMRQLPTQLDQYTIFIKRFVPDAALLTQPSASMHATGWLGEFDTETEPKPTVLALLTKLETQVRQQEGEALTRQAMKVGRIADYFDKIGAFAAPVSTIVSPGAVYQAQLSLVQAVTNGRRHFSVDGREIPTNPATAQGLVQFKIPAARPGQPDTVRAQWHGRVQTHWSATDTVLETTVPYFIVKPPHR